MKVFVVLFDALCCSGVIIHFAIKLFYFVLKVGKSFFEGPFSFLYIF